MHVLGRYVVNFALPAHVAPVVSGKLLIHSVLIALALLALAGVGMGAERPELAQTAVLMAAMPAMGIYPILAQTYGQGNFAAFAMLAMMLAAFFTIAGALWIVPMLPLTAAASP